MKELIVIVIDFIGLYVRLVSYIIVEVLKYKCDIFIINNKSNRIVNLKLLMNVLIFGVK